MLCQKNCRVFSVAKTPAPLKDWNVETMITNPTFSFIITK